MLNSLGTKWHNTGISTSLIPWSHRDKTEGEMLDCQALLSQAIVLSSAKTAQTTGELSAWYYRELCSDNPTYPQDFK